MDNWTCPHIAAAQRAIFATQANAINIWLLKNLLHCKMSYNTTTFSMQSSKHVRILTSRPSYCNLMQAHHLRSVPSEASQASAKLQAPSRTVRSPQYQAAGVRHCSEQAWLYAWLQDRQVVLKLLMLLAKLVIRSLCPVCVINTGRCCLCRAC